MRIGILETGRPPTAMAAATGDYPTLFADLLAGNGFAFDNFAVLEGDVPADPRAADGWLITGSRHGTYDPLPWIAPLEHLIRDAAAARVPLVGICFGHQIIAQALGGTTGKHPGGWQIARQTYDTDDSPLSLLAWHQDQVSTLPPGARVTASNPGCAIAGFAIGDHVRTYQAHPEYGPDFIEGLMQHRGGAIPQDLLTAARATLHDPTDRPRAAREIAQFLQRTPQ